MPPFNGLNRRERERIAASVEKWELAPGSVLLVEGGPPGTRLFVVFDGVLELTTRGQVIDVVTSGGQWWVTRALVTGLAPELTVRARDQVVLYAIPRTIAIDVLSRPQGVAFVTGTLRERLVRTAQMIESASDQTSGPCRRSSAAPRDLQPRYPGARGGAR